MDAGAATRWIADGDLVIKVVLLQAAVAALVLFLLKKLLERALFICALDKIAHIPADEGAVLDEVVVVSGRQLSGDDEFRLRAAIRAKCPRAEIVVGKDRALGGGIVIRAGCHVLDFSLWMKMGQLFKFSDT